MTDVFPPHPAVQQPVVLDLFCGAGGMSLGFQMADYTIALALEKEPLPYQTHQRNFGNHCVQTPIEEILAPAEFIVDHGIERVDVIIGGPPCQGFSRVGRGKMRHLRAEQDLLERLDAPEDDPRNRYYRHFFRFVEELQPAYFVMENVPDLQWYENSYGLVLDHIQAICSRIGYTSMEWRVLRASHYGVPQTRKRLFIVGNRLGIPIHWPQPTHERAVTVWEAISDLPIVSTEHRQDEMPYVARRQPLTPYQELMRQGCNGTLYNHQTRSHNAQDIAAFTMMEEGGRYVDLPAEYKRYRDDIFKDKYRKLYRNEPSWTIEAHIGKDSYRYIYPSRVGDPEPPRTISVREAARLQSFPDSFRFVGPFTRQFMQVGNAVPPFLARAVATALLPDVQNAILHPAPVPAQVLPALIGPERETLEVP